MGITKISIRKFVKEDDGSISVLVIGLFLLLLTISLILTDITSIYLAKRSLSLATEAAVQRAMKNLDEASYYSGEYNFNQLLVNSFGEAEKDPGIPINCGAGLQDVQEVLRSWQQRGAASIRENVANLRLKNYECDGFQIHIETSATAQIPVLIPFIDLSEVEISSFAGAVGERAATNNYYGFDIG